MKLASSAVLIAVLGGTAAFGVTYHETFLLTGTQETPPNNSPGFGAAQANIALDTTTDRLSWTLISANLTGPITAAHFHGPAAPGEAGPIQIDLSQFGTLGQVMSGSAAITPVQEQQILDGLWYLNIHTPDFPNGEIRGQLPGVGTPAAIPEPATLGTLALALGALAFKLRKRT